MTRILYHECDDEPCWLVAGLSRLGLGAGIWRVAGKLGERRMIVYPRSTGEIRFHRLYGRAVLTVLGAMIAILVVAAITT